MAVRDSHLHLLNPEVPYSCNLSGDALLKAQKELHEKPEWRQRDIQELRERVQAQTDLNSCLSDAFLLRFMRAKKFDYDQSLHLLNKYYSVRFAHPEVFTDLSPSSVLHILGDTGVWANFLSAKDYRGSRILFVDMGKWKPESLTIDELLKVLLLLLEKELCHEPSQVFGISVIIDIRSLGVPLILQHLKPAVVKKISTCLQGAFPIRLKAIHLIHESTLLDVMMAVVKPFLTDKLRQRLYFHGNNAASLAMHMDMEQVPQCIGGCSKQAFDTVFIDQLKNSDSYFHQLSQYGFVKSPRSLDSAAETGPLRSVFHSYKKICIDGLNH